MVDEKEKIADWLHAATQPACRRWAPVVHLPENGKDGSVETAEAAPAAEDAAVAGEKSPV